LLTKLLKQRKSTLHTKLPSILSNNKQMWKNEEPTTFRTTNRNGKKKENNLPLSMQEFKKNKKLTLH